VSSHVDDNKTLRTRVRRAITSRTIESFSQASRIGRGTIYTFLAGFHVRKSTLYLLELAVDKIEAEDVHNRQEKDK